MKYTAIIILILSTSLAFGQDAHFSHIHASPLNNNPAWTGVFNDDVRLIAGYRNQWKTPTSNFNTFALSVDGKYAIPGSRISLNGGFSFLTDQGGDLNYGVNNYNFLSGATVPLDGQGHNFFSLGIQLGFIDHHMDISKMVSLDYEPLVHSVDLNQRVLDISIGGGYFISLKENQTIYAGAAVYHLNQPNVSLIEDGSVDLYKRWVANLGAMWEFRRGIGIQPSIILYWQGPHREINAGGFVSFPLSASSPGQDNEIRMYFGLWTRYYIQTRYSSGFDAMVLSTRCDIGKVILSASVDLTVSKLLRANSFVGSPEISVIYSFSVERPNRKVKKHKMHCPKF